MNPQALELNNAIKRDNPGILELLSQKGLEIFFPKKGLMAQSADAKGKGINATIGAASEEDGSPMRLECIAENIKLSPRQVFPYSSSFGELALREKWLEMIQEKNPRLKSVNTSLPVVTHALTHGLSMAAYMFINPGDTLILPDLFWGNYNLLFKNAYGAEIATYPLFDDNNFNVNGLKDILKSEGDKKILIMNFPNNPTGFSPSDKDMDGITEAIKEAAEAGKKIIVINDDAYYGLVYEEGISSESLFARMADLHENVLAVKTDGATKEDYVWGFRVGFITYAGKGLTTATLKALEDKTAGAIRGNISNCSNLSQNLLLTAYNSDKYAKEKEAKYKLLTKRYNIVKKLMTEREEEFSRYFTPLPYNSGYFMCLELKELEAEKVRQILLEKYDTGIIALGNLIRIAYSALSTEQIPVLYENIYNACKDAEK